MLIHLSNSMCFILLENLERMWMHLFSSDGLVRYRWSYFYLLNMVKSVEMWIFYLKKKGFEKCKRQGSFNNEIECLMNIVSKYSTDVKGQWSWTKLVTWQNITWTFIEPLKVYLDRASVWHPERNNNRNCGRNNIYSVQVKSIT